MLADTLRGRAHASASATYPAKALGEALAVGAASGLPLTHLDLSHNALLATGVLALSGLLSALPHGLAHLDLTECAFPVPSLYLPCTLPHGLVHLDLTECAEISN